MPSLIEDGGGGLLRRARYRIVSTCTLHILELEIREIFTLERLASISLRARIQKTPTLLSK